MRFFILLFIGAAGLFFASDTFAQYGRATTQGVTTAAPNAAPPPPKLPVLNDGTAESDNRQRVPAGKPVITITAPSAAKPAAPSMADGDKVVLFFDDFSIKKTMGGQVFCQMTFYVQNSTNKNLDALVVDLEWPGLATNISFDSVPPDDLKTSRYALAGKGCYTMGTEPKMTVSKCIMRAFDKANRVIDVPEALCKSVVSFR